MSNGDVSLVEAQGPAARLWRNVYKKAAQAAEARLAQLLSEHVYHLHGRRALAVVLDGGGAVLTPGTKCDLELPWAYVVEGWALYADQVGVLGLDLQVATSYTTYPVMESICGETPPGLTDALKNTAPVLTDWTMALPRGTVLRVVVAAAPAPVAVQLATLTLYVRAA